MSDIDLTQYACLASKQANHLTHYYVNLPFAQELRLTSNTKFPGTMVVSLAREHLPLLKGFEPHHAIFDVQQIQAYLSTKRLNIPTLHFPDVKQPIVVVETHTMDTLEFANEHGFFEHFTQLFVNHHELEFS